jgi:hypothetical protein
MALPGADLICIGAPIAVLAAVVERQMPLSDAATGRFILLSLLSIGFGLRVLYLSLRRKPI